MGKVAIKWATKKMGKVETKTGKHEADEGKSKGEGETKNAVITAYLMNGDRIEFFDHDLIVNDIRVAAANKLDPKRFAPEITVFRGAQQFSARSWDTIDIGIDKQREKIYAVADYVPQDLAFWHKAIRLHSLAADADGLERAAAALSSWKEEEETNISPQFLRSVARSRADACAHELRIIERSVQQNGAPQQATDGSSWWPLNRSMTQMLLEHEVSSLATFHYKNTGSGSRLQHIDVEFLLKHGANVHRRNHRGMTRLIMAARADSPGAIAILLDYGADINAADGNGRSSLSWASAQGNMRAVHALLARGADVNAVDNCPRSSLTWALVNSQNAVAHVLIKHGADANAMDKELLNKYDARFVRKPTSPPCEVSMRGCSEAFIKSLLQCGGFGRKV